MNFECLNIVHTVNWTLIHNCFTRLLKSTWMGLDEFLGQFSEVMATLPE